MSRNTLQELLDRIRPRYLQASKKEKTAILDGFIATTGYHRKYAIHLLRHGLSLRPHRRRRKRTYPASLDTLLARMASVLGWPSTRYLHSFLPALLVSMEEHGEIVLTEEERRLLLQMSPSTMERRLAPIRRREGSRLRRAPTKPGSRLQARIPVRTWKDRPTSPGWMEFDLVAHSGSWSDGEFFWTINGVDFATGWTEFEVLPNRGERAAIASLEAMATRLPFALRGIDSDNDSAFINQHLFRYCQQRNIEFTRSRPYRKNDQAYIEQRNWTVVRQYVGYGRYETPEALAALRKLYTVLRPWVNFFRPVVRLQEKEVKDGKVRRRYDRPQTPYQRVMASSEVDPSVKEALTRLYRSLNPVALCKQISALQEALWAHATVR